MITPIQVPRHLTDAVIAIARTEKPKFAGYERLYAVYGDPASDWHGGYSEYRIGTERDDEIRSLGIDLNAAQPKEAIMADDDKDPIAKLNKNDEKGGIPAGFPDNVNPSPENVKAFLDQQKADRKNDGGPDFTEARIGEAIREIPVTEREPEASPDGKSQVKQTKIVSR